jgi:hypothetical protein
MPHSSFDQAAPRAEPRDRRSATPHDVARRSVERVDRVLESVFEKARKEDR